LRFLRKHFQSLTVAAIAMMLLAACSEEPAQKPVIEPFGIDLSRMDKAIKPGEDFYRYVSGTWDATHEFPADSIYEGTRSDLSRQRIARIAQLINDARENPGQSILSANLGRFYNSYMNVTAINELGLTVLKPQVQQIDNLSSHAELFQMFAGSSLTGLPTPIKTSVFYDFHHPGWLRYTIEPGGIALSRKTYLDGTDKSQATLDQYGIYIANVLTLFGDNNPQETSGKIISLEKKLAEVQWPAADARNFLKTANSLTIEELQDLTLDYNWTGHLEKAGVLGVDKVIVKQPDAMQPLVSLIEEVPLDIWKQWAKVHLFTQNADYLSEQYADVKFDFFSRYLSGLDAKAKRETTATKLAERYFGMALGQLYVERWFPEENKIIATEMFENIKMVMLERIIHSSWMSDYTKSEAVKKIETLNLKVGYPNSWDTTVDYAFSEDRFYENLQKMREVYWTKRSQMLFSKLPRDRWMTSPQTSGAAANPGLNEITMPAGTLEPPFFDPAADPAVNYGAIGAIFGHELSHMFDQIGRQMDATGKLRDWWDAEDAKEFQAMADQVINLYSEFDTPYGGKLNGKATANENIADISGISLAYEAYKRTESGQSDLVLDGYTSDQRFFMSWAQMRTEKMREALYIRQSTYGPHAPGIYRVNGVVRHHPAWYQAFEISRGDTLYLPPEQRVNFWNTTGQEK